MKFYFLYKYMAPYAPMGLYMAVQLVLNLKIIHLKNF